MERYNSIIHNVTFKALLERLSGLEEGRPFCRHDLTHLLDVSRIAYIMALESNMDLPKDIIYAAGLLHDAGRVAEYEENLEHHVESARIAGNIMRECGYNEDEIGVVTDAIMGHREEKEGSILNNLLYMADKLSRNCFCCKAYGECNWNEHRKNKGVI